MVLQTMIFVVSNLFMQPNTKKRIGILRGGTGKHYVSSLQKGGEIILHISEKLGDKYKVADILIDKERNWHLNGTPVNPADLIHKIDVVWNTAEPNISVILDNFSIPNVGHGFFSSALEDNKDFLKEHIKSIGVQMPRSVVLSLYQKDFDGPRERYAIKKGKEIFEKFSGPWTVKSFTEDSNMAIHLAKTFPELVDAIEDGVKQEKSILVEEFISGKVASVHSVRGFRMGDPPPARAGGAQAGDIYTFPLGNSFGSFSADEKEKLALLAKNLHKHVGAKHYLKSDFVLTPRGKVYLLQIDGNPDLKQDSHFSQACESVGAKTYNVVEHIIESVL